MKYYLEMTGTYTVRCVVDADSESDAQDIALSEIDVVNFAGNGGVDKIMGVRGDQYQETIEPNGDLEINYVELYDEDNS